MTTEPAGHDDEIAERLAEWDELIERGVNPQLEAEDESTGNSVRLRRGLTMLRQLQQLRVGGDSFAILEQCQDGAKRDNARESSWSARLFDGDSQPHRLGRFEVARELGRGGFGVVFLAHDSVLHRQVALKIPRFDVLSDPELRERFFNEARIAAGLDHTNIVPVYDAGQIGPVCFIAYAYCPGPTLAQWLPSHDEAMGLRDAARIVHALADAVHYAHEKGILHRDLKPTNVILQDRVESSPSDYSLRQADATSKSAASAVSDPPSGIQLAAVIPRITDFGLAKIMDQNTGMTQSGAVVGTPGYMSPEQARGSTSQLGRATDVYGLGAILYELIAGRPPFRGESPLDTLHQVLSTEPVSLRRLRARLPRDLETVCQKCLQKEPQKRYASARELADDLRRFLQHEPIRARPVSALDRIWRWCRRRPLVAGLTTALLVLGFISSLTIFTHWLQLRVAHVRLEQARQTEQAQREIAETTVYFQAVALAQHQWRANRIRQAQILLEKAEPTRRGWEWFYVKRLCDSASLVLKGHRQNTTDVRFSPDGRRVVSAAGTWGSADPGELRVWDLESGQSLWDRLIPAGPVWKVAFSANGRQVAASSSPWRTNPDEGVTIWDATTGRPVIGLDKAYIYGLSISPDGNYLAAAENGGAINIYETQDWHRLHRMEGHTDTPFGLAFHPDSRRLVSGARDHTVRVWDVVSGKPCMPPLPVGSDVRCVAVSPDGLRIASGDWNANVQIWQMDSGERLVKYLGHREAVGAVQFSPDGHYVASGGTDREIRIWNCVTGKDVNLLRGHDERVQSLAFDNDGSHIASAGCHNEIRIWSVVDQLESEPLTGLMSRPMDACFDVETSEPRFIVGVATSVQADDLTISYAGSTASSNQTYVGHTGEIVDAAVSRDGQSIVSCSRDGTIRVWEHPSGRTVQVWAAPNVSCVAISRDGSLLATGQQAGTVALWKASDSSPVRTFQSTSSSAHCVAFSPDGMHLAAGFHNGEVHCWRIENGKHSAKFAVSDAPVSALAWSLDGKQAAVGSAGGIIHLYDAQTWLGLRPLVVSRLPLAGHSGSITGIDFSPDGRRILTGSADASAKLWDTATGTEAITLVSRSDPVRGVQFSPDGHNLLVLGGGTRLWRTRGGSGHRHQPLPWSYHIQELDSCYQDRHWYGVLWHSQRLIARNRQDAEMYVKRGDAHAAMGDSTAADADFAAALAIEPQHPQAMMGRALLALRDGRHDQYQEICESILPVIDATSDEFLANQLVWTCLLARDAVEDPARLAAVAERLVKVKLSPPLRASRLNTLAAAFLRVGMVDRAQTTLAEAVSLRSSGPDLFDLLVMAIIAGEAGNRSVQESSLEKIQESLQAPASGDIPWRWYVERDILLQQAADELPANDSG